jgi:hypothetical protein
MRARLPNCTAFDSAGDIMCAHWTLKGYALQTLQLVGAA